MPNRAASDNELDCLSWSCPETTGLDAGVQRRPVPVTPTVDRSIDHVVDQSVTGGPKAPHAVNEPRVLGHKPQAAYADHLLLQPSHHRAAG
jgi:hypothetical protein